MANLASIPIINIALGAITAKPFASFLLLPTTQAICAMHIATNDKLATIAAGTLSTYPSLRSLPASLNLLASLPHLSIACL